MKKVILICGKAESGKDKFARSLEKEFKKNKVSSFTFPITYFFKQLLKKYYNWNGKKDIKGRTLMQNVGQEWNKKSPAFCAKLTCELLTAIVNEYEFFIITGVRRKEEINYFKKKYPSVCVNIIRENHESILTDEQKQHETEKCLDDFSFDFVIENKDTKTLNQQVKNFIKDLTKKDN